MYRTLYASLLGIFAVLFTVSTPITEAQAPLFDRQQHPMLEMMRFVPDGQIIYEALTNYINYEALQSANGLTVDPVNFAEWDALEDYERTLWIHRSMGWTTGPPLNNIMRQEDAINFSGFDSFTVEQAITFGDPPANGVIYTVPLDRPVFETAMNTSNYEQTTLGLGELEAWCPTDGCDVGVNVNPAERNLGFIFDNSGLGRRPPILIDGNYVATSFPEEIATAMAESYTGDSNSLVDNDDYGALFRAMVTIEGDAGTLVQMTTVPTDEYLEIDLNDSDVSIAGIPLSAENLPTSWANYGPLSAYTAFAMASYQSDDELLAAVMAVYDNEADAQVAADELAIRVRDFANEIVVGRDTPLIEALQGDAVVNAPQVIADENGRFVAVVSVSYPPPSEDEDRLSIGGDDSAQIPGFLFRRWVNSIYQRSFDVIWSIVP